MSKALLFIDIQNDYFAGGAQELVEPEKALANAKTALKLFRDKGLPIIHVQHINTYPAAHFFLLDTEGAKIHKDLTPVSGESVIVKHMANSFYNTDLLDIINEKGISELIICGMMTHMCIDTTVRAASDHGIPVTLLKDACATCDLVFEGTALSAKQVSDVYFASLNNVFAKIISTSELTVTE